MEYILFVASLLMLIIVINIGEYESHKEDGEKKMIKIAMFNCVLLMLIYAFVESITGVLFWAILYLILLIISKRI